MSEAVIARLRYWLEHGQTVKPQLSTADVRVIVRDLDHVAALTAENERLRETLTLGLGEQESVIAGLRAENERLRLALRDLLDYAPPPIAGRNDYSAARDAARAALPSSRETTDG